MWSLQEILFPITSYEMSVELQMQVSRPDTKLCPFSPILNRAHAVVYDISQYCDQDFALASILKVK